MPKIHIPNSQSEIEVVYGEKLINLASNGIIPTPLKCRAGSCGTCSFEIVENPQNLSQMTKAEERYFKKFPTSRDCRLACQCKIIGDVVINCD